MTSASGLEGNTPRSLREAAADDLAHSTLAGAQAVTTEEEAARAEEADAENRRRGMREIEFRTHPGKDKTQVEAAHYKDRSAVDVLQRGLADLEEGRVTGKDKTNVPA